MVTNVIHVVLAENRCYMYIQMDVAGTHYLDMKVNCTAKNLPFK